MDRVTRLRRSDRTVVNYVAKLPRGPRRDVARLVRVRVASTKTTPALSRVTRVALPTEPGRGHGESQHSRCSSLCHGPAAT